MSRLRSGDLTIVAIALAATAALAMASAGVSSPADRALPGSSFSTAPDGGRAAFLALRQAGRQVERSFVPFASIDADPARSVVVLANPAQAASQQDRRALRRFVEQGAIVLATGAVGAEFLGIGGEDAPAGGAAQTYHALVPSALSAGAPAIALVPELVTPGPADGYQVIYGSEEEPVVQAAWSGRGRTIWWAGTTPLTNGAIARESNLALLVNALGSRDRLVLWDEYYHGHSRSFWSYLAATPLPWAGAQALLLALAGVLTFSRRRGPVRPLVSETRTSPMEFVETLGGLYEQAGAAPAAIRSARARLRRELIRLCGVDAAISDDRLAEAAAARGAADASRLRELLSASGEAARDPGMQAADALTLVQRLQTMTAAAGAPLIRERSDPHVERRRRTERARPA